MTSLCSLCAETQGLVGLAPESLSSCLWPHTSLQPAGLASRSLPPFRPHQGLSGKVAK